MVIQKKPLEDPILDFLLQRLSERKSWDRTWITAHLKEWMREKTTKKNVVHVFWHFYIFFNSGMNHLIFLSFPLLSGRSCQSWSMIHILTSFFQPKSLLASNPTLLVKLQGGVCARYQIPSITAVGRLLWCFWREEELCACVCVCVCGCEPLRACMHVCACVCMGVCVWVCEVLPHHIVPKF